MFPVNLGETPTQTLVIKHYHQNSFAIVDMMTFLNNEKIPEDKGQYDLSLRMVFGNMHCTPLKVLCILPTNNYK